MSGMEDFQRKIKSFEFISSKTLESLIEVTKYEGQKKDYHCISFCSEP